ncbi:hypothetical protein SB461_26780 [Burkholderia cenocepacia]|nr:hypothetical protein [Burkholderia cenocepacia]MEB2610104.1 hypothetical protein [Burkholderia cenocepacia]
MNYRTKNRLGIVVVAFLTIAVVFAASMSGATRNAASVHGVLHAQQR